MRDSFLLYTENAEQLEMLTDEQAGALFKAIMAYQTGKPLPELDGMTAIVFSVIRQKLDRDAAKYEEVCEKRREAGKKKANADFDDAKKANAFSEGSKKANAFSEEQKKQMHPDNDNDPDNDNEHDNEHDNEPENDKPLKRTRAQGVTASGMVEARGFSGPVQKTVLEWIKYKTEKRQGYKETGLKSLLSVVQRQIDLYGEGPVIRCIEDSMASGWQGIAWGKLEGKPKEKKDRYEEIRSWFTEDTG
jgi:hypothetical protein